MNIKFNYLYRDAANYKQYGEVVFSNIHSLPIETIEDTIRNALIEREWFIAKEWKLKDLHYFMWDSSIDHDWHEYEHIEITEEQSTNGDIADFLLHIQIQSSTQTNS